MHSATLALSIIVRADYRRIESGQIKKGSNDENFTQEAAFDASRCHRVCHT
jgi:hypothetical protein